MTRFLLIFITVAFASVGSHAARSKLLERYCNFPDFVQLKNKEGRDRSWHSHVSRHNHDHTHQYYLISKFEGKFMNTRVIGGTDVESPNPFKRECLQEMRQHTYMVAHMDSSVATDMFACMSFIRRSDDVFQIKISKYADRVHEDLCSDDNLVLDHWPYVNQGHLLSSRKRCPFSGGFNIHMYDTELRQGLCDTYKGEARLESECMKGEGLTFYFRHKLCIPKDVHMDITQKLYCVAHWHEDDNEYVILRHDHDDHQWCLRYPTNNNEITGDRKPFSSLLFKDLVCDTALMPNSNDYVRIDMMYDTPRPLAALCVNDMDFCNLRGNPCRHAGSILYLACPRTCGVCDDEKPALCTMAPNIQGRWLDLSSKGRSVIKVTDSRLLVNGLPDMQCVKWSEGYYYDTEVSKQQMLVTTFNNGCRPRYQCAQFTQRSPSILHYRLSSGQIWPFENTAGNVVTCASFEFKNEDKYRTRHNKVLVSVTERVYVNCELNDEKHFYVEYHDGSSCNGTLIHDTSVTAKKMLLTLKKCAAKVSMQEFACLDSWKHGYLGDRLIVSEALQTSSALLCWLLPKTPGDKMYLLPVADCNDGAKDDILSGKLEPIATFQIYTPRAITPSGVKVTHEASNERAKVNVEHISTKDGSSANRRKVEAGANPQSASSTIVLHRQSKYGIRFVLFLALLLSLFS